MPVSKDTQEEKIEEATTAWKEHSRDNQFQSHKSPLCGDMKKLQ